jgi:hypothetical protein
VALLEIAVNRHRQRLMTAPASGFGYLQVEPGNPDVVRIIAGGEIKRMKKSVARLDRVFPHEIVRCVTVVAGGRGVVARLHPGVVLRAHGMAVGACRWVVQ